jgi:hypothetical protein
MGLGFRVEASSGFIRVYQGLSGFIRDLGFSV